MPLETPEMDRYDQMLLLMNRWLALLQLEAAPGGFLTLQLDLEAPNFPKAKSLLNSFGQLQVLLCVLLAP